MTEFERKLNSLANLPFDGKGENYVREEFLTPLLKLLGYGLHEDYEIRRDGDDDSKFKLRCPPVERGNKKKSVIIYDPDYRPMIRKKMFWVIEAKTAKRNDIDKDESVIQGWQYCLHPEIQAKYLVLSNGKKTKIFDIYESSYGNRDIYDPVLTFTNAEIIEKWKALYNLLSPEKLRGQVEHDLIKQFEKICLSSLDKKYPKAVSAKISSKVNECKAEIKKHVNSLRGKAAIQRIDGWKGDLKTASDSDLLVYMEGPLGPGNIEGVPAVHYVRSLLKQQMSAEDIFKQLTDDYEKQTIFRKKNTFAGLCELHNKISSDADKQKIIAFLVDEHNLKMNAFNKAEAAVLRINQKIFMVNLYVPIEEKLRDEMESLPEIIRFVNPPNVLQQIRPHVLGVHHGILPRLRQRTEESCEELAKEIMQKELSLEQEWKNMVQKIPQGQRGFGEFEYYGLDEKVDCLENIVENFNLDIY